MEAMRSLRVRRDRENYVEKLGLAAGWSLNISMYVVCIHCVLQLYIDSLIVTNKYKMQINVLAAVTRFIILSLIHI